MAGNYTEPIGRPSQKITRSPGLLATKISFVCAGVFLTLYAPTSTTIPPHMLEVISLVQKHTFPRKTISQNQVWKVTGSTHLKGNGYFIRYGADSYTTVRPQTIFSEMNL